MLHYKSLFVALAAVSTVAAGPCKPITKPALSTTTTVFEEATGTSVAETTTTEVSITQETDITITAAPTTTADVTTTTAAQTTTTAAAPPSDVCGITGLFLPGRALTLIHTPQNIATVKECLQGCAAWDGCEVIAYYNSGDRCEYFSGELVTDGIDTPYKWYEVGCLAYM